MVAKHCSPRRTENLPLKTGHLKIDKMLSYAVYHWHTAWNLKEIMLWTSNTSLKIENILLASVACSFQLLTLGYVISMTVIPGKRARVQFAHQRNDIAFDNIFPQIIYKGTIAKSLKQWFEKGI